MQDRIRRPSPAMGVAFVALALSVSGGSAVAQDAYTAAKRLISGSSIKKNSIPANRLTASARRQLKGNTGPAGATGPQGIQGPPGAPDTSKFYDKASSDSRFLGIGAVAADSDKLDGLNSTDFLGATAKASDAESVDGVDSAALARTGAMIVTEPGTVWQPFNSADPLTVIRYTNGPAWTRSAAGTSAFVAGITVPASANGKRQRLDSVRYCYDANPQQVLSLIYFEVFRHADDSTSTTPLFESDPTDRTDAACRTYTPTAQVTLQANDAVELYADVNYSAAGSFVWKPVSLHLSPTAADASFSARGAESAPVTVTGRGGTG